MAKEVKRLPDSELEVMQVIWRKGGGGVSRGEIEAALRERHPLAATTILTFLTRLCEKGFLAVERRGRGNVYTPLVAEKDYLAGESRRVLERLFGGSLTALAASLVDAGVEREEIEELRRMLEEGRL